MTRDEFERRFSEALAMRDAGQPQAAIDTLLALEREGIERRSVVALIGLTFLYELGDETKALPFLQESVRLSPDSERASIGLFHALFDSGQTDRAFDEMKRFL